jgi:hypothetical protein
VDEGAFLFDAVWAGVEESMEVGGGLTDGVLEVWSFGVWEWGDQGKVAGCGLQVAGW